MSVNGEPTWVRMNLYKKIWFDTWGHTGDLLTARVKKQHSPSGSCGVMLHFYTYSAPTARFGLLYRNVLFPTGVYHRDFFCIYSLVFCMSISTKWIKSIVVCYATSIAQTRPFNLVETKFSSCHVFEPSPFFREFRKTIQRDGQYLYWKSEGIISR